MQLNNIPEQYLLEALEHPGLTLCRVSKQSKGAYELISAKGEISTVVSGKFMHEAKGVQDYPAVGDYVMADMKFEDKAVIHALLSRKSVFLRAAAGTSKIEQVICANIDIVFICMSLNADFNLRRLERYLTAVYNGGAVPVVVLTKSDLCPDVDEKIRSVEHVAAGVDSVCVSSETENGYNGVLRYLTEGVSAAFVGSSGVGKSTMINNILCDNRLLTAPTRIDDKGRHTTTHRELIPLKSGATVIDTPGMRELGSCGFDEGISEAFADIEELAARCRFRNCTHTSEPGCAVKNAVEQGILSSKRLESYKKLTLENQFAENSESYLAQKEKKFKAISKANKSNKKRL